MTQENSVEAIAEEIIANAHKSSYKRLIAEALNAEREKADKWEQRYRELVVFHEALESRCKSLEERIKLAETYPVTFLLQLANYKAQEQIKTLTAQLDAFGKMHEEFEVFHREQIQKKSELLASSKKTNEKLREALEGILNADQGDLMGYRVHSCQEDIDNCELFIWVPKALAALSESKEEHN